MSHKQFIKQMRSATCSSHLTHFFMLQSVLDPRPSCNNVSMSLLYKGEGTANPDEPDKEKQNWTDNFDF